MPETEDSHNSTLTVTVVPTLAAFWSRTRCWHGEKLTIVVRSTFVPDGTSVDLTIFTVDGRSQIEVIQGQTISGSKLDYEYTINWKEKVVPAGKNEFVVVAVTRDPAVTSPDSPSLFVDRTPPILSY